MIKITKTTPREGPATQNGMPEPVPYVYRQQERRNDWAARIARRNAQAWWQAPAVPAAEPKADAHTRPQLQMSTSSAARYAALWRTS
jgi:hypothetical protein